MDFDTLLTLAHKPIEIIFAWLLCLTCFPFALIKGRWVERLVALGFIAGLVASSQISKNSGLDIHYMNAMVIADVCLFAFILPFALYSDRYWPMWMLGVWIMMILIDFVLIIQAKPNFRAFSNSSAFWTDASMIIIGVGTWWEGSRRPPTNFRFLSRLRPVT